MAATTNPTLTTTWPASAHWRALDATMDRARPDANRVVQPYP